LETREEPEHITGPLVLDHPCLPLLADFPSHQPVEGPRRERRQKKKKRKKEAPLQLGPL
jgi:hypothetical protein